MTKERLYIAVAGDSVSIYHRPTYQYITSCTLKDLRGILKDLLSMTTEAFYRNLIEVFKVRIRTDMEIGNAKVYASKEKEDWYLGAWKQVTDKFLKQFKLKMVEEDIPVKLVKQLNTKESAWKTQKTEVVKTEWKEPKVYITLDEEEDIDFDFINFSDSVEMEEEVDIPFEIEEEPVKKVKKRKR